MPFKVSDFHDLVELLETHPQWRAQLRRLVLSKDVLALPRIVQELAAAQQRSEERLTRLEAAVQRLAEAQQRSEERLTRLEVAVQQLAEAQQRSEERLTRLEAAVQQLAEAQQRLAEAQQRSEERLTRLEAAVQQLAEAQQRSEERLTRLEAAVQQLAEAQRRSEERLTRLEAAVQQLAEAQQRLAEAQQRTEARVDTLAAELQETRRQLGRLSDRVGVSIEDEAADILRLVLERKGYRAERDYHLALDGEVDVVLPLHDAQGQPVWAVLEAKVRLGRRAVEAWAKRMRDPNFQDALRAAGVAGPYLVYAYGMRVDESARDAAQQFGIGLLSSRGEEVPPTAPLSA